MATIVTETLIDDLDGAEASETVRFTIGGKSYEIDSSAKNTEQKDAFRRWAKMPNARRISDERVQAWIDTGRPIDGRAPDRKASAKRTVARKKTANRRTGPANR